MSDIDNDSDSDDSTREFKILEKLSSKIPPVDLEKCRNRIYCCNKLTIGKIQSGKTQHQIITSIYLVSNVGMNVVMIVAPSLKVQIRERLDNIITRHNVEKYVVFLSNNRNLEKILQSYKNVPKIYIIGANYKNIHKLNEKWCSEIEYYVIMDEGDLFNSAVNKQIKNNITLELSILREKAYGDEIVTATPYSLLYLIDDFPVLAKNVEYLEESKNYVGYGNEKFHVYILTDKGNEISVYSRKEIDDFIFIRSIEAIIKNENNNGNHSVRLYVNITESIIEHMRIKNILSVHYIDSYFIIANNSEFRYYSADGSCKECNSMAEAYDLFQNGTKSNDSILFTIGGKQIMRGHSVRNISSDPNYIHSDLVYCNCQLFDCSGTLAADNIMQSIRIFGDFPGYQDDPTFRISLYTTKRIKKILKQRYKDDTEIKAKILAEPDKYVTQLIPPTDSPRHKVVSRSRGKIYEEFIEDMYYHTEETAMEKKISTTEGRTDRKSEIRTEWKTEDTIIARFMRSLANLYDKDHINKSDLLNLFKRAGAKNPSTSLVMCTRSSTSAGKGGNGYGTILLKISDRYYCLYPDLRERYRQVFID
jgi:hypothetical protein